MDGQAQSDRLILLGRVSGVSGVDGLVKIESYTEPRTNVFRYSPWILKKDGREWQVDGAKGREQGKTVVGRVPEVETRDQALKLVGTEIWVARSVLPKAKPGEFYWTDLEGLTVTGENDAPLGTVSHLFSTGSNDVIVVKDGDRERMIPFIMNDVIRTIDLDSGLIETDWDPDF